MNLKFTSEEGLEDYLFDQLSNGYCPITNREAGGAVRQLDTRGYGIMDIVCYRPVAIRSGRVVHMPEIEVLELKNVTLGCSDISQIARYKKFMDRMLEECPVDLCDGNIKYRLVGPGVPNNTEFLYLADSIDWLNITIFEASPVDGVTFYDVGGWHSKDEDFRSLQAITLLINGDGNEGFR